MSESNIITFECRECGAENDAEIWLSISADDERNELREGLMTGSLFMCECAECGAASSLKYPCLYHDSRRKFMVYLIPDVERSQDFANMTLPPEILMSDINMAEYTLRVVQDPSKLVEKIHTFENGIDDRGAEVCLLLALGKLHQRRSDYTPAATHFERREDRDVASFISAKGETAQVYLDSGLYDDIMRSVKEYDDDERLFRIVDIEWAKDFVREVENRPKG